MTENEAAATQPTYTELLAAVDDFRVLHSGILRALARGLRLADEAEVLYTDQDDATGDILVTIRFGDENDRTYRLTITEETP